MLADCHIHMVLDGVWYKDAIAAHREGPREDLIRARLETYKAWDFPICGTEATAGMWA